MMALANMAMCLAEQRTGRTWPVLGFWTQCKIEPCPRAFVNSAMHPVSFEYYAILDRLARGEAP